MTQLIEYISKGVLARYGLPVPPGRIVSTADEAAEAAKQLGTPVVIKAQVPVGGRGKAGAIQRAETPSDAAQQFRRVISVELDGLRAVDALVEPWQSCTEEYYLAIVVDADMAAPVLLFSESGGVDIESKAAIDRIPLRSDGTVPAAGLRRAAYSASVPPKVTERLIAVAQSLARSFTAYDARLVEINPLGVKEDQHLLALDARLVADDNALYRQPELRQAIRDSQPRRREDIVRDDTRLEYVRLDGWLGLISGGAGMTMAAMDLIADHGGEPACFLDCSANPTTAGYGAAFDLLLEDPNVHAILVSIFGGLTHMDRVARTLLKVFAERTLNKPVTLRLMGTNIEAAEQLLKAEGWTSHRSFEDAVEAAITSARVTEVVKGIAE
jgi:succinyl-CoA synthetase beta subunit